MRAPGLQNVVPKTRQSPMIKGENGAREGLKQVTNRPFGRSPPALPPAEISFQQFSTSYPLSSKPFIH